jgi:hypothetical protein
VQARGAGEPVFLDGAPDQRSHRGALGVGEIDRRHWSARLSRPGRASAARAPGLGRRFEPLGEALEGGDRLGDFGAVMVEEGLRSGLKPSNLALHRSRTPTERALGHSASSRGRQRRELLHSSRNSMRS